MKSILTALLWIFLIVLIIFIFPKTCGSKYLGEVINSNIEYKCLGFPGPNLSEKYNWCYGICSEKSREITNEQESQDKLPDIPIIASFTSSFKKILKPILIILFVIGIVLSLQKFQRAGKKDIVVYSNRMR